MKKQPDLVGLRFEDEEGTPLVVHRTDKQSVHFWSDFGLGAVSGACDKDYFRFKLDTGIYKAVGTKHTKTQKEIEKRLKMQYN